MFRGVPRGGPDKEVWQRLGLGWIAKINEPIWAIGTAGVISLALGSWWPMLSALTLWAGEIPGYMHLVSDRRVAVWRLNLHGLLMLNPLMGFIYELWRGKRVPVWAPWLDGWTAYAELTCGAVTAAAYLGLWWLVL